MSKWRLLREWLIFQEFSFLGKMLNRIWTLSFREKTLLRNFAKKQEERLLIFRVLVPHTVLITQLPFCRELEYETVDIR